MKLSPQGLTQLKDLTDILSTYMDNTGHDLADIVYLNEDIDTDEIRESLIQLRDEMELYIEEVDELFATDVADEEE